MLQRNLDYRKNVRYRSRKCVLSFSTFVSIAVIFGQKKRSIFLEVQTSAGNQHPDPLEAAAPQEALHLALPAQSSQPAVPKSFSGLPQTGSGTNMSPGQLCGSLVCPVPEALSCTGLGDAPTDVAACALRPNLFLNIVFLCPPLSMKFKLTTCLPTPVSTVPFRKPLLPFEFIFLLFKIHLLGLLLVRLYGSL